MIIILIFGLINCDYISDNYYYDLSLLFCLNLFVHALYIMYLGIVGFFFFGVNCCIYFIISINIFHLRFSVGRVVCGKGVFFYFI